MKTDTTDIKRLFLNSLKRGTGEAYLIVRDNPNIDFSTQIIKGALNIFAYDGQSEGSRGKYIFDIISIVKQKDKIRKAILKGLATEKNDTWSLTHLFDLTKLYAQQGDNEARQAIYNRFLNEPIEGSDWVGYSEILELDGLKGLLFIAEKFGRHIEQNPEDWQDDSIIRHFQEENKELKVKEELEKASKKNSFIKLYLDTITKTKNEHKKHKQEKIEFNSIIEEIINSRFLSLRRQKNLTENEILEIATQLLKEKNKSNFEKLLYIFYDYKFPFQSEFILKLAKQKKNTKNRINEFAIYALQHLKSEEIRQFALDKIQKSKRPFDYLEILISNYSKGDFRILCDIANKFNDEHIIENLAGIYTEIYKANKTTECKEPLEILYNKMNCGIHRNGIIEVLIENKVISDKIKKEIPFDSFLETRELLNENKN
ncbi:hypothetical protein [Lacihabitans sp. CS3-21]|uniref:hypothetical protein n=1 Tax=Lacihabitans sp. CS3-21 TaxID=2487332 RepID=UPI0020CB7461|nr:hypothetical protein [Lacihabitans sp. CS3-21]MCP9748836.1 hypothetical protein [Lacihabitans sp. CS3-21]